MLKIMDKDSSLYLIVAIGATIIALISSFYFYAQGNIALAMGLLGISYTAIFAGITILLNDKTEKKIIEKINNLLGQQKKKKSQS